MRSFTVTGSEDQLEVGEFAGAPDGCPVAYATTVSPEASFMTLDEGVRAANRVSKGWVL